MYNIDKIGSVIGVVGRDKRIFSRADYKKKKAGNCYRMAIASR